jgi:O-antigen ligase
MREWKNSYGMGVGAGNSVQIQIENDNTHGVYSMHNFWIEILVEAGILFFVVWCLWYFLLVRKVFFIGKRHPDDFIRYNAKAASLALIGLTIGLISMSSAIYFLPMYLLFGISFVTIRLAE